MKKVTLVTGHYWASKRKAGFHHLAQSYRDQGWEVLFFTAPISWFSKVRGDYRFEYDISEEKNKFLQKDPDIYSYVHYTAFHAFSLRSSFLDFFSWFVMRFYDRFSFTPAKAFIENSDLIIFESTPAILLLNKFKNINSEAKFVYRVSDDMRLLNFHPSVINFEEINLKNFDRISVPSSYIKEVLNLFDQRKKLTLDFHGIDKSLFDKATDSPYKNEKKNVVFVGNSYFDRNYLDIVTDFYPELLFHIIGPVDYENKANVICYGEVPFVETIPYVKFADVGLQIRSYSPGIESLTDSLKIIQYTYCQLPIICPNYIKSERPNFVFYEPNEVESIKSSINIALNLKREFDVSKIRTWQSLAIDLYEN